MRSYVVVMVCTPSSFFKINILYVIYFRDDEESDDDNRSVSLLPSQPLVVDLTRESEGLGGVNAETPLNTMNNSSK